MRIIYEDAALVAVNKPSGLLSVPGRGPDKQDCVVNRLRALRPQCIAQPAVHRLDMDTSGLMLLGLTQHAHRQLSAQFASQQVGKWYLALLDGLLAADTGEIRLPFRLDLDNRPCQIYDPVQGKWGLTRWRRLAEQGGQTLVLFAPLTGRTHQLRLHAAHPLGLGCPIVGDRLYGSGRKSRSGPIGVSLMLHAARLRFTHPESEQSLDLISLPTTWSRGEQQLDQGFCWSACAALASQSLHEALDETLNKV